MPSGSHTTQLSRLNRQLLIALFLFIAGLLLFFAIYTSLDTQSGIAQFDAALQQLVTRHSYPPLTIGMHFITNLLAPFMLGIATIIGGIIWIKRTNELWRPGLLFLAMGFAFTTSFIIKNITMRTRPPFTDRLLPLELNHSFPSGHVLALTTLLLVLGYLWYSRQPSRKHLAIWMSATISGTLLIAFSRVYLSYHWLTDVSASVGLALIILAVIMTIDYFKPQLKLRIKRSRM